MYYKNLKGGMVLIPWRIRQRNSQNLTRRIQRTQLLTRKGIIIGRGEFMSLMSLEEMPRKIFLYYNRWGVL